VHTRPLIKEENMAESIVIAKRRQGSLRESTSGIMLMVERDDPVVLGGSGRRMPYGRRLAEKEPGNLSG
jgi:hypothetical protein